MSLSRDEVALLVLPVLLVTSKDIPTVTRADVIAESFLIADEFLAARTQPAKGEVAATRYDWSLAHPEAQFIATDSDGAVRQHVEEPLLEGPDDDGTMYWRSGGILTNDAETIYLVDPPADFADSLEARPK